MSELIFGLFLLGFCGGWLTWMLKSQRTPNRGIWKPSYERRFRPGAYWQEVAIVALMVLLALGLIAQSALNLWNADAQN